MGARMREVALTLLLAVTASTSAIANDQKPQCDLNDGTTCRAGQGRLRRAPPDERPLLADIPASCTIPNRLQYRDEEEEDAGAALGACGAAFKAWTDQYPTKNKPRRKVDDCMLTLLDEHLIYSLEQLPVPLQVCSARSLEKGAGRLQHTGAGPSVTCRFGQRGCGGPYEDPAIEDGVQAAWSPRDNEPCRRPMPGRIQGDLVMPIAGCPHERA